MEREMTPYYKGGDGSVYHAMFPEEGAEETDGPIRSADGRDPLAELRLIKAEAIDGQPFKHCGLCIKMVSGTCARTRKCLHEVYLTAPMPTDGFDWFMDPDKKA
jgi:hypothetical protein